MNRNLLKYLFIFVTFSFVGWTYEFVVDYIIADRFFYKHGIITGPFVPEYGIMACIFFFVLGIKKFNIYWKTGICVTVATLTQLLRGMMRYFFQGKDMWKGNNFFLNILGHVHPVLAVVFFLLAIAFFIGSYISLKRLLNKYAGHRSFSLVVGIMSGLYLATILQTFVFKGFK